MPEDEGQVVTDDEEDAEITADSTRPSKDILDRVSSTSKNTRPSKKSVDRVEPSAENSQNAENSTRPSKILLDRVEPAAEKTPTKATPTSKEPEEDQPIKLPFPSRQLNRKTMSQFQRFAEMVRNLEVTIPFSELILQIPTYGKFMKDILTRKRTLGEIETVALAQDVSDRLRGMKTPPKLDDPGSFTLKCHVGRHLVNNALCDLGASVSIVPFSLCEKINSGPLKVTNMRIQLADRSWVYPRGILEDVPVKVGRFYFPVDFIVMDIDECSHVPVILGRPFLCTAGAVIDVKQGRLSLEVGEDKVTFDLDRAVKNPMIEVSCHVIDVIDDVVQETWSCAIARDSLEALSLFDGAGNKVEKMTVKCPVDPHEKIPEDERKGWDNDFPMQKCSDGQKRKCVPWWEVPRLLKRYHELPVGSRHRNPNEMANRMMMKGYYWPTMYPDSRKMVTACDACSQSREEGRRRIVEVQRFLMS